MFLLARGEGPCGKEHGNKSRLERISRVEVIILAPNLKSGWEVEKREVTKRTVGSQQVPKYCQGRKFTAHCDHGAREPEREIEIHYL
jgi:hypothetical protein